MHSSSVQRLFFTRQTQSVIDIGTLIPLSVFMNVAPSFYGEALNYAYVIFTKVTFVQDNVCSSGR